MGAPVMLATIHVKRRWCRQQPSHRHYLYLCNQPAINKHGSAFNNAFIRQGGVRYHHQVDLDDVRR
jgi:hypothetical protein